MVVFGVFAGLSMATPALAQDRCAQARDLRLTNGRIHTLDARDTVVTEVTIQDGKFTAVGRGRVKPRPLHPDD